MMNGLLIFDNDPKASLVEKIQAALVRYESKRKQGGSLIGISELKPAELCLVNQKDAEAVNLDEASKACGVTVKTFRGVNQHHLWVGYETMPAKEKA